MHSNYLIKTFLFLEFYTKQTPQLNLDLNSGTDFNSAHEETNSFTTTTSATTTSNTTT